VSLSESQNPESATVAIAGKKDRFVGVRPRTQVILLQAIRACVLLGILVAGLWPFHAPRNEVSWLSQENGLLFGKYGSIVSSGAFEPDRSQAGTSCSLEIWLTPSLADSSGTILAFFWPTSRVVPFALRQSRTGLAIQHVSQDQLDETAKIYVSGVFRRRKSVFVTISSGETGTAIYEDGTLLKKFSNFRLSNHDMTGRVIVGNAPSTPHNWLGQVNALAIYDRELRAPEVVQHFTDRTKNKPPDWDKAEGVVAGYLFNEGKGNVVHNQVDSATNLLIPERFFVLHEKFLERPWDEFHSGWHYWEDLGINISGFIPIGFFLPSWFATIGKGKWASWLTIALGFSVSLMVEVLQSFLPTRESGMTDLITNTFGTALGTSLWVWGSKSNWLVRLGGALL
jgi:VanZ like family/Concanavalin A-like lectin/glucanases superfamily